MNIGHLFGLKPWEMADLTARELAAVELAVDELRKR